MNGPRDPRHLAREGLDEYLAAGGPSLLKIEGQPSAFLTVDPFAGTIGIRVDRQAGDAPDLEPYKHFVAETVAWQSRQWVEIRVAPGVDPHEAYPILCAILDRVQIDGVPTGPAVQMTLENYRELLAGLERLSDEAEVGLFGELLVLEHFVTTHGGATALDAWCGPDGAEHDFSLATYDVEVKTTTSESRQHWIHNLGQLVPSPGRVLLLLSIQLTSGGAAGIGLPTLVSTVRASLGPAEQTRLDQVLLSRHRWNARQTRLYRRTFRLRSQPTVYVVDDAFPAITPAALTRAALDASRFARVHYQLDVSGLASVAEPIDDLHLIGQELP